jgi:PEP-CTERM motif
MQTRNSLILRLTLGAVACWTSAAGAQVLVNDTWLDGTRTDPAGYSENGVDVDADGNLESSWFRGGDGTLAPVGAGGPLRAQFSAPTSASSASWTTYFTPAGSEVNLASPGDQLRLTWRFIPDTVNATNTNQNMRIALVDTPEATLSRPVIDAAPGDGAYAGYALFLNFAQTTGRSTPFQLYERSVDGNLLASSGNWTGVANAAGFGNGAVGYADDTTYELVMTLTRTAANELDILATMTGGNINGTGAVSVAFTDATPDSFVFDTFALRPSGATTTADIFDTSLFRVEVVPEPATLSLLGFAGLALVRRRR